MTRSGNKRREGFGRYHVRLGGRRTTATLDRKLSVYLALHLGEAPNTPGAHGAIQIWMQAELDRNGDPGRVLVSHWLYCRALDAVVQPGLKLAPEINW